MRHRARGLIACVALCLGLAACNIGGGQPEPLSVVPPAPEAPTLSPYDASATPDPFYPSARLPAPVTVVATVEAVPSAVPATLVERVNVLILGVDERATWSEGPPRSDGIMLVSIDPATNSATVLSVPRDLWVNIPGYGQERINVAYRVAEMTEPGTGPAKACETVSEFLGVPVTKYAVVNFRAVVQIIDALGGVEVDVPQEIWDYQYPTEDNQFMTVHFAPGPQTLDGEQALQYIRTRHGNSDFDRMRRQQQVIAALRERVLRPDFLAQAPGLLLRARDSIRTNVSVSEMLALWDALGQAGHAPVRFAAVDETLAYPWVTVLGADVLLPNTPAIAQLVDDLGLREGADAPALAQGLQIRLFSGSDTDPGFVSAAQALSDAGYAVVQGGVKASEVERPVILDYSSGAEGPKLAKVLGLESGQVLNLPRPVSVPPQVMADVLLGSAGAVLQ